jgi:hypothetical protein
MSAGEHSAPRLERTLRLPVREGYGPTLGLLLAERLRRTGRRARALALIALLGLLALAGALASVLGSAELSYSGGPIPFSFSFSGMHRVAPEAGGEVRVASFARGALERSFAVSALALPPYSGSVTGVLPLAADRYTARMLAPRFGAFALIGEGPVRTDAFGAWEELPPTTIYYHLSTYAIAFTARIAGNPFYGRVIWLLPGGSDRRWALLLTLLERAPPGRPDPTAALSLGTSGPLSGPLRSFGIG